MSFLKIVSDAYAPIKQMYIDPGTGSMLFTILVGTLGVAVYGLKSLILKLRTSFGHKTNENSIPFVIFTDSKRYWNVFKPICDEFEKRGVSLVYYTQSQDDPIFDSNYEFVKGEYIGDNNRAFTKLNFLKADVLLSTTPSLDVFQWKRSKDVKWYVHIPHACSDITLYRLFGIDYYDAILLSGAFQIDQIRKLEELRNLPAKELKTVGLTYFDVLKERRENTPSVHNEKPVVLIAPTWGQSSILKRYGKEIIDPLINTGYEIVVRPHPQSFTSEKDMIDELMKNYPTLEWNRDTDNFDILNRADIMISDYSGVVFDFSLVFDKPIIYADTQFDDSPYDAHWIDDDLWTFKVLPKIGMQLTKENVKNIKQLIDDCLVSPEFASARKEAVKQSWEHIGQAANLIADYLIDKQKELNGERQQ